MGSEQTKRAALERKSTALIALFFIFSLRTAFAKEKLPDQTSYLNQVTERGRALYAYDQAAWHGTDAVMALNPDRQGLENYLCEKSDSGWVVLFGRLNPQKDKLSVVYEARETSTPGEFIARKLEQPREEAGFLPSAEKALQLTREEFSRDQRPYNDAVLPAPEGNLYVYIYPAQTKDTVWPLGGDVRYTVSPDGSKIVEKRQLHSTILDLEFKPGTKAGFHTHVLSDVPEDTDVLYVLNRKPTIPEYVGVKKLIYIIAPDGSISTTHD